MTRTLLAALAASTILVGSVQAQGLIGGAQQGVSQGNAAAGPIGGIVGGAVGAATGTVGGVLGGDPLGTGGNGFALGGMGGMGMTPGFGAYVAAQNLPTYSYAGPVRVGAMLPRRGVVYYVVPQAYGATPYRYTVVNNQTVLVDTRSRRIVQVF